MKLLIKSFVIGIVLSTIYWIILAIYIIGKIEFKPFRYVSF